MILNGDVDRVARTIPIAIGTGVTSLRLRLASASAKASVHADGEARLVGRS